MACRTILLTQLMALLMGATPGIGAADSATPAPAAPVAVPRQAYVEAFAKRELKQGPNPGTWVDSERWCVAHACLETGVRLEEANRYLAEVPFVSLWHGLVADTDVQITDLLATWFRFRNSERLGKPAREHLLALFHDWQVPNPDRNRTADTTYEWPAEYTENHSLNILAAAYLIDIALERDRAAPRQLLQRFFQDRARWGWSEFHSPRYGLVTAKVLVLLAESAADKAVAEAARLHLDLLALEFANTGFHTWRALPSARGGGFEVDNRRDALYELARLWFGPGPGDAGGNQANPMLLHALLSGYRPPAAAADLLRNLDARGTYTMAETVTTGPGKLRVPLVIWVSPAATMASAQGSGSYYDGVYWSISFASGPDRVVTGRYGKGRTLFQQDNVLVTFGEVNWHGPLTKAQEGNVTLSTDGKAWVGQIDLEENCHLLLVSATATDKEAFRQQIADLQPVFDKGEVRWRLPDGSSMRMLNRRDGERWRFVGARRNDLPVRVDRNMLYDSPWLHSERDSARVEVKSGDRILEYDFTNPEKPEVRTAPGKAFAPPVPEQLTGPEGIRLLYVPPGEFPMGSPATEGRANERPLRWVSVPGFYIGETEITVAQYKAFLKASPKMPSLPDWYEKEWGKTEQHPVTWVTWGQAQAFCQWLSATTRQTYRLPTEAEWEKAARGYSYRVYPWGEEYDGTQSGTPNGEYAPAGRHPLDVSPFGVRGLAGNAWEWCADWYADSAHQTQPADNPRGPEKGEQRVLRGCGWNFDPDTFRCAYRTRLAPGERSVHIGFRVVLEPPGRGR